MYQDLFFFYKVIDNLVNIPKSLSNFNIRMFGRYLCQNVNTFDSTLKGEL